MRPPAASHHADITGNSPLLQVPVQGMLADLLILLQQVDALAKALTHIEKPAGIWT